MANDNLQSQPTPATPTLALELEQIFKRVSRMEALLKGAESILSSIRYEGELSFTPADDAHQGSHRRAYGMIEFLRDQLENWRELEEDLDEPSDDIWVLMEKAQHGQLIRYAKPMLEPVE